MSSSDPRRPPGDLWTLDWQDSTGAAVMGDRQYRELKKYFFSPPSKCPIDLFGPLANGTELKRLHVVLLASVLRPLARTRSTKNAAPLRKEGTSAHLHSAN